MKLILLPRSLILTLSLVSGILGAKADEFDTLRLKWAASITGIGYDLNDPEVKAKLTSIANSANSAWSSMSKAPTRTYLWEKAASTTYSAHITTNYNQLKAMALGYTTKGCSLYQNASLAADIISGLDWMYANRYNSKSKKYDNWFDWQIGAPAALNDIVVLLYSKLSATQISYYMSAVDHFTPTPLTVVGRAPANGANLMSQIQVVGVRGCIMKDARKLALARDAFSDIFPYVTSGDGFYPDGSYVYHGTRPYTGGYGAGQLAGVAVLLPWLAGSTWAVKDPAQVNVYQWIFNAYQPIIYRGLCWNGVIGRQVSKGSFGAYQGACIMASILQIAQSAPAPQAAKMKSMLKAWALQNTQRDFVGGCSLANYGLAHQLMADPTVKPRSEPIGHFAFPSMDRVMHLGAGYGFGLSLCSSRISNFESFLGNNLHGWFTGDGMTTLFTNDLSQYTDNYEATVDPYRRPGTTADTTANKLPANQNSNGHLSAQGQATVTPYNWAGGVTLGNYGAAGMQLKGCGVSLTAKKSWFMFDHEIVCLGADISSTDTRPIETIVDNRKLSQSGTDTFIVNGTAQPTTLGWSGTLANVKSASLAGTVAGSDIGYYFPQPTTLIAVREARTGAWADVDINGSASPVTRNYLRFGFDHGSNPTNAAYQYVLLPGANAQLVSQYAAQPQVSVIVNSGTVQAVSQTALGITAANFWTDTAQRAGIIAVDKKCSVMIKNDGTFLEVAVSDPTQANTGTITVQVAASASALLTAAPGVTVEQTSPRIVLTVNVKEAAGHSFYARFRLGTPQKTAIVIPSPATQESISGTPPEITAPATLCR